MYPNCNQTSSDFITDKQELLKQFKHKNIIQTKQEHTYLPHQFRKYILHLLPVYPPHLTLIQA